MLHAVCQFHIFSSVPYCHTVLACSCYNIDYMTRMTQHSEYRIVIITGYMFRPSYWLSSRILKNVYKGKLLRFANSQYSTLLTWLLLQIAAGIAQSV